LLLPDRRTRRRGDLHHPRHRPHRPRLRVVPREALRAGSRVLGGGVSMDPELEQDRVAEPPPGAAGSLALRDVPIPDYCDVVIVPAAGVEGTAPRIWAEACFSRENSPLSSRGLRALRDETIRLFDMVPPPQKEYVTDEVVGSEALIIDDDEKLTVRIGVALLPGGDLLQVTTAVKYRSIRGRLAFAPRPCSRPRPPGRTARSAAASPSRRAGCGTPRPSTPSRAARRRPSAGAPWPASPAPPP